MSEKKTFIITGANSGLGFECAKYLANETNGCNIIFACRSKEKGEKSIELLRKDTKQSSFYFLELDLMSLDSVRRFVSNFKNLNLSPLTGLVCNAGIVTPEFDFTSDGIEKTFGVNHLGHFLLTNMLLGEMDTDGRIIFVSSGTHDPSNNTSVPIPVYENGKLLAFPVITATGIKAGQQRYSTSKLCNIYCTYELAEKIQNETNKNITVNAFDPGMMGDTGFSNNMPSHIKFIFKLLLPLIVKFSNDGRSAKISGQNLGKLIIGDNYKNVSGKYFKDLNVIKSSDLSYVTSNRKDLWKTSVELTNLTSSETILKLFS